MAAWPGCVSTSATGTGSQATPESVEVGTTVVTQEHHFAVTDPGFDNSEDVDGPN